jgi:hypothetical protein
VFSLNKEIKAKNGQILIPYLVDNETVYCQTRSGKIVIKTLSDFYFNEEKSIEKKPRIISVVPTLEPEDTLFTKDEEIITDSIQAINIQPIDDYLDNNEEQVVDNEIIPVVEKEEVVEKVENVKVIYSDTISSIAIDNEDYI